MSPPISSMRGEEEGPEEERQTLIPRKGEKEKEICIPVEASSEKTCGGESVSLRGGGKSRQLLISSQATSGGHSEEEKIHRRAICSSREKGKWCSSNYQKVREEKEKEAMCVFSVSLKDKGRTETHPQQAESRRREKSCRPVPADGRNQGEERIPRESEKNRPICSF